MTVSFLRLLYILSLWSCYDNPPHIWPNTYEISAHIQLHFSLFTFLLNTWFISGAWMYNGRNWLTKFQATGWIKSEAAFFTACQFYIRTDMLWENSSYSLEGLGVQHCGWEIWLALPLETNTSQYLNYSNLNILKVFNKLKKNHIIFV